MLFSKLEWLQSMIELSRTQDEEVGDGTTSVIILGMLLAYVYVCMMYLIMDCHLVLYLMWSYSGSLLCHVYVIM